MNENHQLKAPIIFTIIAAVVFLLLGIFGAILLRNNGGGFLRTSNAEFEKFTSEDEFREYLNNSQSASLGFPIFAQRFATADEGLELAMPAATNSSIGMGGDRAEFAVNRVSGTNVQVLGIDEPDIVKTDGRNIYFSPENYLFGRGIMPFVAEDLRTTGSPDGAILPAPDFIPPTTKVIGALPPEAISLNSEIDETGELLVSGNILVVISYNKVTGFDVSNPSNPLQVWQQQFDENHSYNSARLLDGSIYLVTTRYADYGMPCPMPLISGSANLTIACTDIYRIGRPISADTVYSVLKINPANGQINDSMTFVGSAGQSVIYMSGNSLYTTFTTYPAPLEFMAGFFSQNTDLVSSEVAARINNLNNIDISNESKTNELTIIIQRYLNSLSNDERARVESELTNRMSTYMQENGRELQRTSIVKIDKNSLDVSATGEVAGAPLNQFSIDEFNGNLRIATTLTANTMFGSTESTNDVYVLDGSLNTIGQIQGLALGERVYSARFVNDQAYIVTFRQIDPFFVINLSDPTNPKVAGELKIPGFSSYLHPLTNSLILGVGQEDFQSKLSLFDVSSPENPIETSKYTLAEGWSEVQSNHHAFLHDAARGVFFIPGGSSGYVFSYHNGLALERVVSDISARRALYINNYLYIVGDQKIVVLNEDNWEAVGNLTF